VTPGLTVQIAELESQLQAVQVLETKAQKRVFELDAALTAAKSELLVLRHQHTQAKEEEERALQLVCGIGVSSIVSHAYPQPMCTAGWQSERGAGR